MAWSPGGTSLLVRLIPEVIVPKKYRGGGARNAISASWMHRFFRNKTATCPLVAVSLLAGHGSFLERLLLLLSMRSMHVGGRDALKANV